MTPGLHTALLLILGITDIRIKSHLLYLPDVQLHSSLAI